MTTLAQMSPYGAPFWLRWIARGLIAAWAAFWIWFNVMSAFGEFPSAGFGGLAGHLGLAAVVLAAALVAWRWDVAGGLVLLGLSLALWRFFHGIRVEVAILLLAAPAVAGVLLLLRAALGQGGRP